MAVVVGKAAPAFTLPDAEGKKHKLSDYKGKWVLVYFYPKDSTPGCTKEACMMRDAQPSFKKLKATVLGISTDSQKSHTKFIEKQNLNFTLLSDEEKEVVKKYGVWGPKKFMGREFLGTKRMSFLIDPNGKIAKIYETVKPAEHADEVIKDIKELSKK